MAIYNGVSRISEIEINLLEGGVRIMAKLDLEYIRNRRIELNLSQQYLANQLGFKNASTYLKYESGDYSLKADMLPILAKELKVNMKLFFTK